MRTNKNQKNEGGVVGVASHYTHLRAVMNHKKNEHVSGDQRNERKNNIWKVVITSKGSEMFIKISQPRTHPSSSGFIKKNRWVGPGACTALGAAGAGEAGT